MPILSLQAQETQFGSKLPYVLSQIESADPRLLEAKRSQPLLENPNYALK